MKYSREIQKLLNNLPPTPACRIIVPVYQASSANEKLLGAIEAASPRDPAQFRVRALGRPDHDAPLCATRDDKGLVVGAWNCEMPFLSFAFPNYRGGPKFYNQY